MIKQSYEGIKEPDLSKLTTKIHREAETILQGYESQPVTNTNERIQVTTSLPPLSQRLRKKDTAEPQVEDKRASRAYANDYG